MVACNPYTGDQKMKHRVETGYLKTANAENETTLNRLSYNL